MLPRSGPLFRCIWTFPSFPAALTLGFPFLGKSSLITGLVAQVPGLKVVLPRQAFYDHPPMEGA